MTTDAAHEFFLGSAGVAGALIGLLFVAFSVAADRMREPEASEIHAVRAGATLTAFTNALSVSLFGLVPGMNVGDPALAVALIGLLYIVAATLRVYPQWRAKRIKTIELSFLAGLLVVFVFQLLAGIGLGRHPHNGGDLRTICILVIVCFLIGISRAWELVGGPEVGFVHEVVGMLRGGRESPAPGERD